MLRLESRPSRIPPLTRRVRDLCRRLIDEQAGSVGELFGKLGFGDHVQAVERARLYHTFYLPEVSRHRFSSFAVHLKLACYLRSPLGFAGSGWVPAPSTLFLLQVLQAFEQLYPDVIKANSGLGQALPAAEPSTYEHGMGPGVPGPSSAFAAATIPGIYRQGHLGNRSPPGVAIYGTGAAAVARLQQQLRWHLQPRARHPSNEQLRAAFGHPRHSWAASRSHGGWATPSRATLRQLNQERAHIWQFCRQDLGVPTYRLPRRYKRRGHKRRGGRTAASRGISK